MWRTQYRQQIKGKRDIVSGNRLLHSLTSTRNYTLRIDLEDFEGNNRYAVYTQFAVGPEADGFRLTVGGYSGNAGLCPYQICTVRTVVMPDFDFSTIS